MKTRPRLRGKHVCRLLVVPFVLSLSLSLQACSSLPAKSEKQPPEGEPPQGELPETTRAPEAKLDPIAERYLDDARRAVERGEIAEALAFLIRARTRSPENSTIEREMNAITRSLASEAYFTPEPIQKGKGLSSPLQFLLLYRGGGETFPVPDLSVRFVFVRGSGRLTGEAVTNDLGIAKCYVEEITDVEDGVLIEGRAVLAVDDVQVELGSLTQSYEFATLSVFDAPHILIISNDEKSRVPDAAAAAACGKIGALFSKKGFSDFSCKRGAQRTLFQRAMETERSAVRVLGDDQGAKVLVLLDVQTAFLSKPSPDFIFFRAALTMKMIDVQSFRLYFESSKEERGAGPTSDQAEQQAVGNALGRLLVDLEQYLGTLR